MNRSRGTLCVLIALFAFIQTTRADDAKSDEDKQVEQRLNKPGNAAEARGWCDPKNDNQGFKISKAEMLKMANDAYAAGAVKVWVYDIDTIGGKAVASSIAVELPKEAEARKKIFQWEATVAPKIDEDPRQDAGQKYFVFAIGLSHRRSSLTPRSHSRNTATWNTPRSSPTESPSTTFC
jgi:hypothetical protein